MPGIFDNINSDLRVALTETLQRSQRAGFCVGYFNLRGRSSTDLDLEPWPDSAGRCCRLHVGRQSLPHVRLCRAHRLKRTSRSDQRRPILPGFVFFPSRGPNIVDRHKVREAVLPTFRSNSKD